MALQHKVTALYCRLSKDDDRQGESLSIEMQKKIRYNSILLNLLYNACTLTHIRIKKE